MAKILLVEDDTITAEQVADFLKFASHTVDCTNTCTQASYLLKLSDYDLLILDRSVLDGDTLTVLGAYRKAGGNSPVLILTGKGDIADKLDGFEMGADDYLTKPFHLKEFEARVQALLRRRDIKPIIGIRIESIYLDLSARKVFLNDEEVSVAHTDLQLLEFLMTNPDRMFSTENLLNRVWSSNSEATTDAVKSAIKRLRKKLDPDGLLIYSKYGAGYMIRSKLL